jgi:peroxin-11B
MEKSSTHMQTTTSKRKPAEEKKLRLRKMPSLLHSYVLQTTAYSSRLDMWIKFTSMTAGRDKIYRTIQYSGRFVVWYLNRKKKEGVPMPYLENMIERLQRLSEACGQGRKLFRLGRSVDFLQSALKAYTTLPDPIIQGCTMGKSLAMGTWLILDAVQWLTLVGVIKRPSQSIQNLNRYAYRFWLVGLLCSLGMDVYKLEHLIRKRIQFEEEALGKTPESPSTETTTIDLKMLQKQMNAVTLDLVRDLLDLLIPGSALGYIQLESGVVGLIGTITSLIGAYQIWPSSSASS